MGAYYGMLADAIGLSHAAFVLFVVVGQGLILVGWARRWAWTRGVAFRALHLAAISFVVIVTWLRVPCPLTVWESHFRVLAGRGGYEAGFIETWLERLLYYDAPGWVFAAVYSAFGALVLFTFALYPPRRRPS